MSYKKHLFTFISFLFFSTFLTGQPAIQFTSKRASSADDLKYREYFKEYSLGTLSTKTTSDLLRSQDHFPSLEIKAGKETFTVILNAKDLRSPNFKLRYADDTGIHEMPRTPNLTYQGFTKPGNYDVRVTADDGFFTAMILRGDDAYFIEQAKKLVPGAPDDLFVMYWESDNLKKFDASSCGVDFEQLQHAHHDDIEASNDHSDQRLSVCRILQVALANDFEMFQEKGSVSAVQAHNMGVINNVYTNYDTEFTVDMEFDIVEIFVAATSGADPWTNSLDPGALLDDFTDWAVPGFSNTHDVGGLWTNRDFTGQTIGLAWVEAVCSNFRYHTCQDFSNNAPLLRCLQAHEMGHNFGAGHDAEGATTIMAPTVQNTNTWSTQSLNQINSYIASINCMSLCGASEPPIAAFSANVEEGCVPLVVNFIDQSDNNPTSWSWTFQGGTPATSILQNPTVTYNSAGSFDVTLTVSNSEGSDTQNEFDLILVNDDPVADFDYNIDELFVDFENLSTNGNSFSWNFGDGQFSTLENPSHEYAGDGTYDVTLTVTNECGTDSYTIEIEIITLPVADFDASDTEGCAPLEIDFYNYSSENALEFEWSFPGGSPPTSTAFEPTILYDNPGTFSVTLTAINDLGQDVLTRTGYITILAQPNATFTVATNGLQAIFNSAGSVADAYNWNFGDGGTSTNANPTHNYSTGGSYTVTLTVTNDCGTDIHTMVVSILGAPNAQFSANAVQGCAPFVVQYINQSSGQVNNFNWVFQGGSPATSTLSNPVVTYNTPGVYDVTLTVSNNAGSDVEFRDNYITVLSAPVSDFDYTINGNQVAFTNLSTNATSSVWDFGDGLTGDDTNPIHNYANEGTYTVILYAEGPCGIDSSSVDITIQSAPNANFSFSQNGQCAPTSVQFTNQSSQNVTSYKWTFEGGTPGTSTQANPLVNYNTPGTYDVQLIVFAPAGSDTFDMPSAVTVGVGPAANFLFATNGTTVDFENLSTNATTYEWLFGDGEFSNTENPSHTYAGFGTYDISLIATSDCGEDTMDIQIVLGTVPNAFFTYSDDNGCAPFEVQFIDQSQNNPTSWSWTFEGGTPGTSILQNPVINYNQPGNYTVTLQSTNANGTDVLILDDLIRVANPPDALFDHTVTGNHVSFSYLQTNYDSLRWDFGDGRTNTSINPTIEYASNGQYTVSLIVYNACGADTASVIVDIITSTTDPDQNRSQWQIRPNPFSDVLTIYGIPDRDGNTLVSVYDAAGKMIARKELSHAAGEVSFSIPAGDFAPGLVLVRIVDNRSLVILKGVHQE